MQHSRASKLYNVPRSTLRDKLAGKKPDFYGIVGRESIIGREMENELKEWLLEMCRGGAPIPKKGLLFSVQHLCKMKDIKTPFKDGMPG